MIVSPKGRFMIISITWYVILTAVDRSGFPLFYPACPITLLHSFSDDERRTSRKEAYDIPRFHDVIVWESAPDRASLCVIASAAFPCLCDAYLEFHSPSPSSGLTNVRNCLVCSSTSASGYCPLSPGRPSLVSSDPGLPTIWLTSLTHFYWLRR